MKFAILASVAASLATVSAVRTVVALNGDCSVADSTCPSVNCCGLATPTSGTTTKKVCNLTTLTTWTDTLNNNAQYTFVCDAVTVDANMLAMSTALATSVALYLM